VLRLVDVHACSEWCVCAGWRSRTRERPSSSTRWLAAGSAVRRIVRLRLGLREWSFMCPSSPPSTGTSDPTSLFLRRSAEHRRKAGSLHRGCLAESNCNSMNVPRYFTHHCSCSAAGCAMHAKTFPDDLWYLSRRPCRAKRSSTAHDDLFICIG
jgi:hypothetical protein